MSDTATTIVESTLGNEAANVTPVNDSSLRESVSKAVNVITEVGESTLKTEPNKETEKKNGNSTDSTKQSQSGDNRPPYIPPHLMGRDLNNPAQDLIGTGRRMQKPRLGVKVPYRNLTSQIVSQDEIAQEILERSLRKYSYTDVPEGGDVFFAMKLTHRLANKISSNDAIDKLEKKNENLRNVVEKAKIVAITKRDVNTPVIEKKDESTFDSKAEELYAEISSTLGEECNIPKTVKLNQSNSGSKKVLNGSIENSGETTELDNDTLLAILEGTTDLNDSSVTNKAISTPSPGHVTKRNKGVRTSLDPNVEKELALKQLLDFETKKNQDRLKKLMKKPQSEDESQNTVENKNPEVPEIEKKIKRNTYSLGSAPKRFPKKYQRIIKRQLRSSKLKAKTSSPDQPQQLTPQQKKLPEVPEVQIAIDKYFKTYANKRKHKPDGTSPEKPTEKKLKEDNAPATSISTPVITPTLTATSAPTSSATIPTSTGVPALVPSTPLTDVKGETPRVQHEDIESDENRNEAYTTDQELKKHDETRILTSKPKVNSKVMREINRLLGDEGAINMIYSIEQKRLPDNKRDAGHLPSLRRKKKDLLLKTKLVKNAVLRLSMSSSQKSPGRVVRRASPKVGQPGKSSASPLRKDSIESVESNTSEVPLPKVCKVAAEASRIIRRHSSSSAYSSDEDILSGDCSSKISKGSEAAGVETPKQGNSNETRLDKNATPMKNSENPINDAKTNDAKSKSPRSSRRPSKDVIATNNKTQTEPVLPNENGKLYFFA